MYYYFNTFFLFSIFGHFLESTLYPSYDSGILNGYWTPIYGFGVVVILGIHTFLLKRISVNKKIYPIILFFTCSILLATLELAGGYLIEFFFHRVFWNYQYHHFNIGLYTSLEMAFIWGCASLLVVYLLKPILDWAIPKIPHIITWILSILFIIDVLCKISTLF